MVRIGKLVSHLRTYFGDVCRVSVQAHKAKARRGTVHVAMGNVQLPRQDRVPVLELYGNIV